MTDAPHDPLEATSLAACLAHVLGTRLADVPVGDDAADPVLAAREWLARHGLGLVPVADPAAFGWAGPWIARVRVRGGARASLVAFGVPPGILLDPVGLGEVEPGAFVEGWVVAPHRAPILPLPSVAGRPATGTVERLLLAPAAEAPMRATDRARAVAGRGLLGDRYADGAGTFSAPGTTGHDLTLVEGEALDALGVSPEAARRNVVTRGIALDDLIGRRFSIGGVECIGQRRCEPCAHLQRLSEPGILRALVHRGGLRADGDLAAREHVGAPVSPSTGPGR